MVDSDAIHTSNRAREPRVILSIIELEHMCPSHRHRMLLLQSYELFHLQSKHLLDPSSFQSFPVLLGLSLFLLTIGSEAPECTNIARGTRFEELVSVEF